MPGRIRRHYGGDYARRARAVRTAANADPSTRCWRCGRTLAQHPRHKTGKAATWQAGHLNDGQEGGPLAPEASTCNSVAGAKAGAARKRSFRTSRRW